ncbi:hypothetical protein [Demequina rhizosphaerae]|uniref:hypothetical protein n=1 Tax=Demequina rhizosphaerae TaxID=1638985 RepID=UPI0007803E2D|nr:hypothetical protein [Demequina rhizosphaerae]
MRDDAAVAGRGAAAAGWVAASGGAALLVLLAMATYSFAESKNRGWLGNATGLETAAPWVALVHVALAAVVGLTLAASRPLATARSAIAGLAAAVVELAAAIVVWNWDFPESGLGMLGFSITLWFTMMHAGASVLGFALAWHARRPVVVEGA